MGRLIGELANTPALHHTKSWTHLATLVPMNRESGQQGLEPCHNAIKILELRKEGCFKAKSPNRAPLDTSGGLAGPGVNQQNIRGPTTQHLRATFGHVGRSRSPTLHTPQFVGFCGPPTRDRSVLRGPGGCPTLSCGRGTPIPCRDPTRVDVQTPLTVLQNVGSQGFCL